MSLFQSPRFIHFTACCCVLGIWGGSEIHCLIFIAFTNCFSRNSTWRAFIYASQRNRQYKMGSATSSEGTSFSRINSCSLHSKFQCNPWFLGNILYHGPGLPDPLSAPPQIPGTPALAYFTFSNRVSGWSVRKGSFKIYKAE